MQESYLTLIPRESRVRSRAFFFFCLQFGLFKSLILGVYQSQLVACSSSKLVVIVIVIANNIQGEDVEAERSQADVLKHLEVNKILEFEETNVTHRRYCGYLTCDQFADYKCNLVVSGKAKSYCFKCFERFRSKVVYCDADSTSSEQD